MSETAKSCSKKRERPKTSAIEEAVNEVIEKGQSINKTAIAFKISRAYLAKIVKSVKISSESSYKHCPNIGNRRIFTIEQENMLADYLKTASKMCHGLTRQQTKKLAFEYAEACSVCPDKWKGCQIASDDWLKGFMKRHKELAVRKPENTSLSRATSFNKTNVNQFFEKLTSVSEKHRFPPHMIFNADETGCSTVTNPPKVIAEKGTKQIGQVTSAERGALVTALFFINAAGGFLPPVFVFPRVNYKDHMLMNGPPGALGLANISGWMNEDCFVKALEHFVLHVKPSKDNPALILMDNHSSHINLKVVQFARQHSIIIVTFPPHCSHKLQPLDVTVYGPFKTKYRIAMNEWMLSNPGKTVTIYHVGQFVKDAYLSAFSPKNITQGFLKTGIYPLNSNIFREEEFLSSFVTDRSDPSARSNLNQEDHDNSHVVEKNLRSSSPSPASASLSVPSTSGQQIIVPEMIRPFSKAGPRKNTAHKNQKMSSAIVTDSEEKNKIKEKEMNAKKKRKKTMKITTEKSIKMLKKRKSKINDDTISLHDTSSSDSDTIVVSKKKKVSKKGYHKKQEDQDNCVVCNKSYKNSSQDWFQCKICSRWGHESCGIKGALNYFCQNCF